MKGLDALHQNNIVHGAVNPNNVFIKPDGSGILAEFDFTKSLVCYRNFAKNKYNTLCKKHLETTGADDLTL